MIYIEYPAVFPCPTWAYRDVKEANEARAPFDCGWTRQRRRWPECETTLDFTFEMPTDLYDNWSRWVRANGHSWFSIEIEPAKPVIMRLIGAVQAQYDTYDAITATAQGEFMDG